MKKITVFLIVLLIVCFSLSAKFDKSKFSFDARLICNNGQYGLSYSPSENIEIGIEAWTGYSIGYFISSRLSGNTNSSLLDFTLLPLLAQGVFDFKVYDSDKYAFWYGFGLAYTPLPDAQPIVMPNIHLEGEMKINDKNSITARIICPLVEFTDFSWLNANGSLGYRHNF